MALPPPRASAWLLSAAGGLALAAAFPPLRLWPLVFMAWVPLWIGVARDTAAGRRPPSWRRIFLRGWLMGFVAYLAMLHWLLGLSNEEVTIPGLMVPSLLLIAFYLGLFQGTAVTAAWGLARWSGLPFLALAPVVTALLEWLRSQGPLGFPWGAPAYALARVPSLIQSASVLGFWGLCFVVLAVSALVTAGVRRRLALAGAAALVVLGLWVQGASVLARHPEGGVGPGRRPFRALVAQPDIRREIKWKPERRGEVIDLVFAHGVEALRAGRAAGGVDLFVWPETVFPVSIFSERGLGARLAGFVDSLGAPLLLGTQEGSWQPGEGRPRWVAHNSACLLTRGGGCSAPYRKIRLVPFSERMPLQRIAPGLSDMDFGQSDFYPGAGPVLFEAGGEKLGTLICFESVFPSLARSQVAAGATVLVNITNDFWFGRTAGPAQHAEMAVLRAVENRVPLVRCANTGLSFSVDPYGRIAHETQVFTRASFVATVPAGSGSFAARHGDWAMAALVVGVALAALAGAARAGRGRRQSGGTRA
jgi:apolipoprotein N-acyltransferase